MSPPFTPMVARRFDLSCVAPRELVPDLRRMLALCKGKNEQPSDESERLLCQSPTGKITDELNSLLPSKMEDRSTDYHTETESSDEETPLTEIKVYKDFEEGKKLTSSPAKTRFTFGYSRGRSSGGGAKQKEKEE